MYLYTDRVYNYKLMIILTVQQNVEDWEDKFWQMGREDVERNDKSGPS